MAGKSENKARPDCGLSGAAQVGTREPFGLVGLVRRRNAFPNYFTLFAFTSLLRLWLSSFVTLQSRLCFSRSLSGSAASESGFISLKENDETSFAKLLLSSTFIRE